MFLLDTHAVSEIRKIKANKADRNVARWAESVDALSLFVPTVTLDEIELGVLQAEQRAAQQGASLRLWLDKQVVKAFDRRISPVDAVPGRRAAQFHVSDPRPVNNAFIAATALIHGLTPVTRNIEDFASMGVSPLNPWREP